VKGEGEGGVNMIEIFQTYETIRMKSLKCLKKGEGGIRKRTRGDEFD
jgi:hypothetical protein